MKFLKRFWVRLKRSKWPCSEINMRTKSCDKQAAFKSKHQLGMPRGTAGAKLKKALLFSMAVRLNEDNCFRCNSSILKIEDFSIEHKIPWLDGEKPIELFFDLENIAFSHLKCNISAARRSKRYLTIDAKKIATRNFHKINQQKHYTKEKRHKKYLIQRSSSIGRASDSDSEC